MKVFDSGRLIEDLRISMQNADTCMYCVIKKQCSAFEGHHVICDKSREEFLEYIKEVYSVEVDAD